MTIDLIDQSTAVAVSREASLRRIASDGEAVVLSSDWHIQVSDRLVDVEATWLALEEAGIESPGQSYEFTKVWIDTFDIPSDRQRFIAISHKDRPIAVLAFERQKRFGIRVFAPFAECHVGTNSQLMDVDYWRSLSVEEQAAVWTAVKEAVDADLVFLPAILSDQVALFGPGSKSVATESLYRTEFSSWEDVDRVQRTRNRRKHDKQQGAKLAASGEVTFEAVGAGDDAAHAIDIMFADRAARFAEQGIDDPFKTPKVRAFYRSIFESGERLKGKMHLLKLDGEVIATRFNLVMQDRMFCLISSMSVAPRLQPGSPGKQVLLKGMQTMFDAGTRVFDMGAGFSDEKRHWCNVQLPLSNVYLPKTFKGRVLTVLLITRANLKARIKANKKMFDFLKSCRAKLASFR